MSRNRKYPYIQDDGSLKGEVGIECEGCDKPATHWVRLAWSYMRGEDESAYACHRHFNMARDNLDRFLAHIRTKERFMSEKTGAAEGTK